MEFDCKTSLSNLPDSEIEKVLIQLNKEHIVLDEHSNFLSSDLIEYCSKEVARLLRKHGYSGGPLKVAGQFFEGHGAVYALYDSRILKREKAIEYMVRWVENYQP
jgi:hypothetical protein